MIPDILDTPVGTLAVGAFQGKLIICDWIISPHFAAHLKKLADIDNDKAYTSVAIAQLKDYFAGQRQTFDLSISPQGTSFQQLVWQTVYKIPFGTTNSYTDIARTLGKPGAIRAVATAIAQNPINIIIPCHRVIASNGTLAGYAGGLLAKKILLELENT